MRFTLLAVAAGILIGVLAGGRPRYLGQRNFELTPLLVAGVALQAVGAGLSSPAGLAVVLLSYLLLLGFAVGNASIVAMWLVALGIAINLLVIAVNAGMPVRPSALIAAGVAEPHEIHDLDLGGKRHLERPSDRLTFMADIFPVPPLAEVLSFGDICLDVGVANVIIHLMRPPRARRSSPSRSRSGAGVAGTSQNGTGDAHGRHRLLPSGRPRRGVGGNHEVGVGPRAAGLRGTHRRR
ncbi:MAG: DUF5317 domain-containing protein [Actinomycetota bacterium]|nr:DUF5317 domain-containing protein [Actinomycetota bacterium]MDQ3574354.1 DUF5317 domain-containing protein [Actinomycetota bacterium]